MGRERASDRLTVMAEDARHFDLVVIGGGPGGYGAALYGASAGLDVAMVEMSRVGGTCLHLGCIPAKELLETAHVLRTVRGADDFGVTASEPSLDLATTMQRKQSVVDRLTSGLGSLLDGRKVTVYDGIGALGPDRRVVIAGGESGDVEVSADHVVLASGSKPRSIPGFDVDGRIVLTSDELLSMDRVPASAAIIGGGAIGCEFASMLTDFGTKVTIIEALPRILAGCDEDVTRVVERSFRKRGMEVRTGATVSSHRPHDGGSVVTFGDGEQLDVEVVIVSVGRRPFPDLLGLDGTSVVTDERGYVVVDELCRTHERGVYAIGDLVDTPQLAHVAFAEAINVVKHMLGEDVVPIDYGRVPWAIYCHPEVAFVGMTEAEAAEAGYETTVSKHRFVGNGRALILGESDGLVKVVAEKCADGSAGQILGVHMAGPWVTEQLGQGYLAVNWEATVDEVAQFVQPHPTLSELFGETVLSMTGRSLHG
jgi:dihydrolipoamide dehydrogenase